MAVGSTKSQTQEQLAAMVLFSREAGKEGENWYVKKNGQKIWVKSKSPRLIQRHELQLFSRTSCVLVAQLFNISFYCMRYLVN